MSKLYNGVNLEGVQAHRQGRIRPKSALDLIRQALAGDKELDGKCDGAIVEGDSYSTIINVSRVLTGHPVIAKGMDAYDFSSGDVFKAWQREVNATSRGLALEAGHNVAAQMSGGRLQTKLLSHQESGAL
jgi:hypothetical protein